MSLKHSGAPEVEWGTAAGPGHHLHHQMVFSGQAPASETSASTHLPIKTNKQTKTIIKTGNVKKNRTVGYQEKYFLERVKAKSLIHYWGFPVYTSIQEKHINLFYNKYKPKIFMWEAHDNCNTVSFRQVSLGTLFTTLLEDIIHKYTYIHVCIFFLYEIWSYCVPSGCPQFLPAPFSVFKVLGLHVCPPH